MILPEGNKIDYDYDNVGNLIQIIDNEGNSINYTYDKKGNKTKEEIKDTTGALQKMLSYQYDAINRLTKTNNPDSSFTECGYDKRGSRTTLKTPNGNTTLYTYDAANRLIKVTQPNNTVTAYTYDRRGNLTSVTDANGNITIYEYDKQSRLTKTISPDTGTTLYTYDLNGNMKTKTDAKSVTITYTYDAANRLTKIDFPDDAETDITYTYDTCLNGKGRLCTIQDQSGITSYEYNAKGQVTKETKTIDTVTYTIDYTYDKNGNIKTMKYPSGRVITYNYSNDKVTGILNNGAAIALNITYKPFGGIKALTYGNGIQQTTSYDQQYRITSITANNIQNIAYTYDNNGNISGIANNLDPARNKAYTYDALDRLTAAIGPWGSLSYSYDKLGNRLKEIENSNETNYTYAANRLISTIGTKPFTFSYDGNGNAITENTKQYIYNQNQRLIKVAEDSSIKGEYVYNGKGQRIKKTSKGSSTIFHYNLQGQLIAETAVDGVTQVDYVNLNGQPLAKTDTNAIYYIHADHLGTPVAMTDTTGVKALEIERKPFGDGVSVTGTVSINIMFLGQYYDEETGSNYNWNRHYKAGVGRYLQPDVIQYESFVIPMALRNYLGYELDGLTFTEILEIGRNLQGNYLKELHTIYAYVDNNPISYIDPEGKFKGRPTDLIKLIRCGINAIKCAKNIDKFREECNKECFEDGKHGGNLAQCALNKCWNQLQNCLKFALPGG